MESAISETLTAYIEDIVENEHQTENIIPKLSKTAFKWINGLFNIFVELLEATANSFVVPNAGNISTYETIAQQENYKVVLNKLGTELSMNDIIERFNTNNS